MKKNVNKIKIPATLEEMNNRQNIPGNAGAGTKSTKVIGNSKTITHKPSKSK